MNAPPPAANTSGPNDLKVPEFVNTISNSASNTFNNVVEEAANTGESIKKTLGEFGSSAAVATGASGEFLQSNSIVAKFAFLILVLIAFLFLANLGIMLIGYFTKPSGSPYLVKGTASAASGIVISQDPKNKQSVAVLRSSNENTGIEFTWCIWIYVMDINGDTGPQYQVIFNKGNKNYDGTGLGTVNNAPGLYIDSKTNQLRVMMNTVSNTNPVETLDISNMPLRKWFHCAIRLQNKILDVYINGVISARLMLSNVPKQNYDDVNVCTNGGFNGNYADLQYYDRAISVFEINNIVIWGRNTSTAGSSSGLGSSDATGFPYYLSYNWYASKF
jgi:hypothetical protein